MNHARADLIQIFIHSVLLVAAAPLDVRKGSAFPARQKNVSGLRPQRRDLGAAQ